MMNLAEYRRSTTRLADFLPWAALVDEGIVLNKDGSFQRTARFRGPDLDFAVPAELVAVAGRLNNALRRLGSGWAVFVEAQRHRRRLSPSEFPDVAIGAGRCRAPSRIRGRRRSLRVSAISSPSCICHRPRMPRAPSAFLYEGPRAPRRLPTAREALRGFVDRTDRVLATGRRASCPESRWLDDAETLTYLHSSISTRRHRVRVPEIPMYLDALLADEPLTGGLEPDARRRASAGAHDRRDSRRQPRPGSSTSSIGSPFAYRWSTRAIMLDKTDATKLLTRIRRQWFAKRKSIAAILKEVMTNEASSLLDTDADNKAIDADAALQELGSDLIGEAYVTATITVWDEDPRIADERLRWSRR